MRKIIVLILLILLVGCSSSKDIVGTWYYVADNSVMTMIFNSDGTCSTKEESGDWSDEDECTYEIKANKLFVTTEGETSQGVSYEVTDEYFEIMGIRLYKDIEKAREYDKENKVTVPDVSGLSVVEAQEKIIKNKLSIGMIREEESDKEKGLVIRTYPEVGEKVSRLSEITIYVSSGLSYVGIEDYTGHNYFEVKSMLEEYGIEVSIEYKQYDGTMKSSTIVDQSVKPGETLNSGDTITLYVVY